MKIIVPEVFGENSSFSTIGATTNPDWAQSAAYSVGDVVESSRPSGISSQFDNADFECVQAIASGEFPDADDHPANTPTHWVHLGPPNRFAALDVQSGVGQQRVIETSTKASAAPSLIRYVLNPTSVVHSIAFMNTNATSVDIELSDNGDREFSYSETFEFPDISNVDGSLYRWLTNEIVRSKNLVVEELNVFASQSATIKINTTSELAEIGAIVLGRSIEIGTTLGDPVWDLRSRSFKELDGLTNSIVRRFPSNSVRIDVQVSRNDAERVRQVLERIEGIAAVYVPDSSRPELTTYGVLTGSPITSTYHGLATLSLRVESI